MLTAHELIGFMPPALSAEILQFTFDTDRDMYRALLAAVAETRKLRPQFLERKPRVERDAEIIAYLAKPRLDGSAQNLLRFWLVKKHTPMLVTFLDALGVPHKDGTVEDLPESIDAAKLSTAVDQLLAAYPREVVAVYLNAFYTMNGIFWEPLRRMLESDTRLQIAG